MGNEVYSAAVAIGLGVLVGTALFVPFVAVSYRRRGRLTLGRSCSGRPPSLPGHLDVRCFRSPTRACAGVNLDVVPSSATPLGPQCHRLAVLQLALNAAAVPPLGRVLGGAASSSGRGRCRAPSPAVAACSHGLRRARRVLVGGARVGVQVVLEYVVRDRAAVVDRSLAQVAANVVPIAIWGVVTLVTGRTVGDAAVELRYRGGPCRNRSPGPCDSSAGSAATCCCRFCREAGRRCRGSSPRHPSSSCSGPGGAAGCRAPLGQDVVDAREGAETDAVPQEPAAK
jgi:hypothetical protein